MTHEITIQALNYNSVSMDKDTQNDYGILTPREERKIAKVINSAINIPFVSEKREEKIFLAGIRLVDTAISRHLPKDLLECIHDVKDGVTQEEVAILEKRMTPIINRMVNIPIIPEFLEARLISMVLGIILNALRVGTAIIG